MSGGRGELVVGTVNAGAVVIGDHGTAVGHLTQQGLAAAPSGETRRTGGSALLVVAADVERDAVLTAVKQVNSKPIGRRFLAHQTIYSVGRISHTEVTVAQVGQGVVTPDSAGPSVPELLDEVKPDFIIMVGICYGLRQDDPKRPQRLGDVLIANELRLIAHKKISRRPIDRGGAVHPSATLLDRFRAARVDWPNPATVHIGPMVSESVLVDSAAYRRRIVKAHPEAIGGEMEGAAVYAAAIRRQTQWGLVKAICDWGYGKNDRFQQQAAANAASLVIHMIAIGGLDPVQFAAG